MKKVAFFVSGILLLSSFSFLSHAVAQDQSPTPSPTSTPESTPTPSDTPTEEKTPVETPKPKPKTRARTKSKSKRVAVGRCNKATGRYANGKRCVKRSKMARSS